MCYDGIVVFDWNFDQYVEVVVWCVDCFEVMVFGIGLGQLVVDICEVNVCGYLFFVVEIYV